MAEWLCTSSRFEKTLSPLGYVGYGREYELTFLIRYSAIDGGKLTDANFQPG
jgi:hypothetical protein